MEANLHWLDPKSDVLKISSIQIRLGYPSLELLFLHLSLHGFAVDYPINIAVVRVFRETSDLLELLLLLVLKYQVLNPCYFELVQSSLENLVGHF